VDLSDHFPILISVNLCSACPTYRMTRAINNNNKLLFANYLSSFDWSYLYTLRDVNKAFSYFIKRLKRIYNRCFPFVKCKVHNKHVPWITKAIIKSIRVKNRLYLKAKRNPTFKPLYVTYRNQLTTIIRKAKINYHKNLLDSFKNNAKMLWKHFNCMLSTTDSSALPVNAEQLNDFFVEVFKLSPKLDPTLPQTYLRMPSLLSSIIITPVSINEVIATVSSLANSRAVGYDGLNPI
jgi:hypothetical protein